MTSYQNGGFRSTKTIVSMLKPKHSKNSDEEQGVVLKILRIVTELRHSATV